MAWSWSVRLVRSCGSWFRSFRARSSQIWKMMNCLPTSNENSRALDLAEADRALTELERRRREGGIKYFEPQEQQIPVLECCSRGKLVLGGNRGGKTVTGAVDVVYHLLGKHPYKAVPAAPVKWWACSQDLPGVSDLPHKQLEELRAKIPKHNLRGGSWATAWSPMARVLTLENGSVVVFKGYDQGLLKFESDAIDGFWFDEEPEDKKIFTSCLMRLADRDGCWLITATPVLSLLGKGWLEDLWNGREDPHCGYEVFQLFSYMNPYLSTRVLDELFGQMAHEERQVRAYGAFARLSGRVLSEFDPGRHIVRAEFLPPREWRHYLVIDPGWNKAGHLFAAVDPQARVWLYAEHYAGELRPEEHMTVLHALWSAFGKPDFDTLMDPAGFTIKRTTTGKESPSDAAEYLAAAEKLGATWFVPRPADNGDVYAWRVKRFLAADLIRVFASCKSWLWEQERWIRQRPREGGLANERAVPDKPIDRDNHLMDPTRYLCNELPDPLPVPEDQTRNVHAEYWQSELDKRDRPDDGVS